MTLFSCGKQTKESEKDTNKEVTQLDNSPAKPIQKHYTIPFDSKLVTKLSKKEISSVFTRRKQNLLGISNTIYQVYSYNDESGLHYIVLTDHRKAITEEKDTLYDNIYALKILSKNNQLKKRSTVKDKIDKDWETSIGFWNKYSDLSDIDGDGLVDMILTYGTEGQNGYKDGRVKIMAYYMGKRVSVKHQNSEIGGGRLTKINKKLYGLPTQIQDAVKEKMRLMVQNKHAVFTKDWEEKMSEKSDRIEGE
ncbi:hypothetical protein GCM10022258_38590 [Aquimarina gracilis]